MQTPPFAHARIKIPVDRGLDQARHLIYIVEKNERATEIFDSTDS